jgi:predicted nucleic acid-binding protein
VIFVDSNIPMYLIGAPHRHKADAQRLLEKLLSERIRLVTDAQVLQEIMHRYAAIDRLDAIQPAFEALLGVVDEVLQIDLATVERAKEILLGSRRLSARDCLHIAAMERHGIETILTFDLGFDGFPGVKRLAS